MENQDPNLPELTDCLDLSINEDQVDPNNDLTLVGRLLTIKHINYKAINVVLSNAWNLGQNVEIKSIDQNIISCTFKNGTDRDKVLVAGPWSVKGATLNLIHWPSHLNLKELSFTSCSFWVQVHNIPPNRMNPANAAKIGGTIGTVLKLDESNFLCKAKKFLRIQVKVDTAKRLKTGCLMNREDGSKLWLPFRYERLSDFCYRCGLIDHTDSACSNHDQEEGDCSVPSLSYGPWLRGHHSSLTMRSEYHHPQSEKLPCHKSREVNRQDVKPSLTRETSSIAPAQNSHQNRNILQNISNVPFSPSRQMKSNTSPPHPSNIQPDPSLSQIIPFNLINTPEVGSPSVGPEAHLSNKVLLPPQAQIPCVVTHMDLSPLPFNTFSNSPTQHSPSPTIRPKRKPSSPPQQLSKVSRIEHIESVYEAMARMNILNQCSTEGPSLATQIQGESAMQEELVTITCRRLIHVKRQVDKINEYGITATM